MAVSRFKSSFAGSSMDLSTSVMIVGTGTLDQSGPAEADRLCGPTRSRVSIRRRIYRDRIYRMKITAYQAPLIENGSMEVLSYLRTQIDVCEDKSVEILCCPEAVLGGLASYSDRPSE